MLEGANMVNVSRTVIRMRAEPMAIRKKWTATASFVTACLAVCLSLSATFSVAERIVAKDQPQSNTANWAEAVKHHARSERVMGSRWVEIGASKYGHYITRVSINGVKVWALVDTGASAVAMSYEDAERAGLNPFRLKYTRRVRTANGISKAALVNLKQVVVEGITVKDVEGMVMRKGAMRGTLLGMSFLRRLNGFRVEQGVLYLEE